MSGERMTVEHLISAAVRDAIMETAYGRPQDLATLRQCDYLITQNVVRRICENPLVFNKLRELLSRRKPK